MDIKKALYYMILSTLSFTLMNGLIKYLTAYNTFELVFFRSLGTLFITMTLLKTKGIPFLGTKRTLMVGRGVIGVTSMILFFMSMKYIPIGSAVAIRYIAPIFASIIAIIVLKEKVKPVQWLFFLVAFFGVLILKGFSDDSLHPVGLLFAVLAAITSGFVYIFIRKIGTDEHPIVIVNYFMFIATIVGGVIAVFNWKTPEGIDILLLASLGIFGYFGQLFMTKAFQMGETTAIAPLKYIEVVFTIIVGVTFLNEIYSFWSFLGIVMIMSGLLLNIWYKQKQDTA